jgi:HAD superfamily hydrolase (TIGR01509 family)
LIGAVCCANLPPVKRLQGVVFDMDGVLCDSEPFICEAAVQMFRERHRTEVSHSDFIPFVGTGENRYLGGVAEKHGVALDLEADKAFTYARYLDLIRGRLGPLPGVVSFVKAARALGLRLAVATSADRVKLEGNLREIGLPATVFDATVNGLEVERKKPAPDIFLEACRRMACDPARCIVVEDAPSGISAGKAAGCRCLGLTTSFTAKVLLDAGADWVAPDLSAVPAGVLPG